MFFEQKHFFGKYLKGKCLPEAKQQLFFKYFVNFYFIPKLFSKSMSSRWYLLDDL